MLAMANRRTNGKQASLPLRFRAADVTDRDLHKAWKRSALPALNITFEEARRSPELLTTLRLLATAALNKGRLH